MAQQYPFHLYLLPSPVSLPVSLARPVRVFLFLKELMAEITVCIEIDETGQVTVGAEPPEGDAAESDQAMMAGGQTDLSQPEESAEKSFMQPAKSIDDALSIARDLLRNAAQVGGAVVGGEPGGAGAQDAANAAFASRRGGQMGGM